MSKRKHLGTTIDKIFSSKHDRMPRARVCIWNPNRTTINEVVLGEAASPMYDVSDHVTSVRFFENVVFEESDEAVATNATLEIVYDPDARPVEITHQTFLDGTPVRIYQGDDRVPKPQWVTIFTGVVRGNPTVQEFWRGGDGQARHMTVAVIGRAEAYMHRVVTARSYEQGDDVGKAAVETAIEWCNLDRREINIGYQSYAIGHTQSQLVDIEVLAGIHQMLFTVGKKPRFDSEGFLVAVDSDLNKPPVRVYDDHSLVISVTREQRMNSVYNSVRLLGLSDDLTEVVEREKRLAHGSITSGYFESSVNVDVWFSETPGKQSGGRRAKNTRLVAHVGSVGEFFGQDLTWSPYIEDDGYTCFGGRLTFDTGYAPEIRIAIMVIWADAAASEAFNRFWALEASLANEPISATLFNLAAEKFRVIKDLAMIANLLTMTELGRVEWEIFGEPFQHVFQQLAATAQLAGVLTADLREKSEIRNDWLYDVNWMRRRARELLDRELVKGWTYRIVMLDDPILDVDDVIEIDGRRYYIVNIRKTLTRTGAPDAKMDVTAWRLT